MQSKDEKFLKKIQAVILEIHCECLSERVKEGIRKAQVQKAERKRYENGIKLTRKERANCG